MSRESKELIVGLDIGTSKIVAIVAEILDEGQLNIVGMGHSASRGLKRGMVVKIESTVQAIQRAREDAEYRQRQGWRGEADNQGELATEADEREVAAKMVSVRTSEF